MTERIRLGTVSIDRLTFDEALQAIESLVTQGQGGTVLTPNVDHVVVSESHAGFRAAYASASLCLVDGMPLLWAAKLLGTPLPEKISGSDLIVPLMKRAADRGFRVYLFGAGPGVAEKAATLLRETYGVNIVGTDSPVVSVEPDHEVDEAIIGRMKAARPDLIVVALGAPKQEVFIHRIAQRVSPAVLLGLGASLDFIAGTVKRAPAWMSRAGLEWFYRLTQEPGRLWRRYLVNDPKFLAILMRDWKSRRPQRSK